MSIIYDPKKLIKKIAPDSKVEKLLSKKLTLKKAALSFIDDIDFIDKKNVADVAMKTIKAYKKRIKLERKDAGVADAADLKDEILDDPKMLINRVQNEIITQVAEGIKDKYAGEFYEWLPSDADEPDPEHQLLYGQTFQVGDGEMPGDRYGCRCGMRILVDEEQLAL